MAALKPAQVDLTEGRIEVISSVSEVGGRLIWGPPKTHRGRRTVVLPPEVGAELSHHMDEWAGDETVFSAPRGGVLRAAAWRRRFWHPAVEEAQLEPLRPYDLRHTAIAFWIQAEGNLLAISRRAGHSSVAFTLDRYGHLFPDADRELSGRLSGLYKAPKLAIVPPIEGDEKGAAASPRPGTPDSGALSRTKVVLIRPASGGASKNRTCDLSIISATSCKAVSGAASKARRETDHLASIHRPGS